MQRIAIHSWFLSLILIQCLVAQQPQVEEKPAAAGNGVTEQQAPGPVIDEQNAQQNSAIEQESVVPAATVEQSSPADPTATTSPSIQISRANICTNVVNREPQEVSDSFAGSVGKLCCFSHITGARDGMTIVHKWYYKYELVSSVGLRIKADNWRTYSSKTIMPEQVGDWKVEIVNGDNDSLIQMVKFTIQ